MKSIKLNCNFLKYIFLFVFIFFFSFVFIYICMPVFCDEVWIYGFCYNISRGMIIYRDFNVVQTPLYFLIGSIFIKIFGSYLISLGILNSILIGLIGIMLFRMIRWRFLGVLPIIFVFFPSGYNLLSLFWLMLILYFIHTNKYNDVLVGIVVGLCFLTKQNIGVCLFIPYFFYSKNKLKSIISFLLPLLGVMIYLGWNNALYDFFNYCFFGLFDFNNNKWFIDIFVCFEIVVVIYLVVVLFRSCFKDKEIFYIFMFQIMCYPIVDGYHFFVSLLPVLYYLIKRIKTIQFVFVFIFFVCMLEICLFLSIDIEVHYEHDILYLRNAGDLSVLADEFKTYLEDNDYSLSSDYYFFTEYYSYLFKLYYDIPINKYDFLMTGNVGYNGVNKSLEDVDDICQRNKCIFFVDKYILESDYSQWKEFYKYIIKNYHKIDEFYNFSVYTN